MMAKALASEPSVNKELNCRFCEKTFNNVVPYIDHIRCRDHYKMVKISEKKNKAGLLQEFKHKQDSKMDRCFVCPECGTKFSCWTNADDHFQSSQHIKKISENEMELILYNMKPKTVPPFTQIKQHPLPCSHQNDADRKSPLRDIENHDHKMLANNEKIQTVLGKTKIRAKADEMAAVGTSEVSLSRVKVRKGISDSEGKERTLKCNNGKVPLRKVNVSNSKEREDSNKSSSVNKDIQVNGVVRSTKGIAYFLPSDPSNFVQGVPTKVPPSSIRQAKQNGGKVTVTKSWNYQEDICISTTNKTKSKSPGIRKSIKGPGHLTEVEMNDSRKLYTTNVTQKTKRMQKGFCHLGAEIPVIQNKPLVQNVFITKCNQKGKQESAVETVEKQSKNRSRQSTDSTEGRITGVEIITPNKLKKNYKSGLSNTTDNSTEQNCNARNNNTFSGPKLPVNKGKVNGQCENCGHAYFIDIMANNNGNIIAGTSSHTLKSNSSRRVTDKRQEF